MPFTVKQQKFIDLYEGNATAAARAAGYGGGDNSLANIGRHLLRNVEIEKAIQTRQKKKNSHLIANREQRQMFWTETMRDTQLPLKERLRASELLGRSAADFTDRIEHSGTLELAESLKKARERVKSR